MDARGWEVASRGVCRTRREETIHISTKPSPSSITNTNNLRRRFAEQHFKTHSRAGNNKTSNRVERGREWKCGAERGDQ